MIRQNLWPYQKDTPKFMAINDLIEKDTLNFLPEKDTHKDGTFPSGFPLPPAMLTFSFPVHELKSVFRLYFSVNKLPPT